MKKLILYLILFLCIACNDKKTKPKISLTKEISQVAVSPLFLDLSPKMNDSTFKKTIVKNEKSGNLINGRFPLKLNDKELSFEVNKGDNFIALNHREIFEKRHIDLSIKKSKKLLQQNMDIIQNLISLYADKYDKKDIGLPSRVEEKENVYSLSPFWYNGKCVVCSPFFTKSKYAFFEDSTKTISIGYTTYGAIIESNNELKSKIDYNKVTQIPKDYFNISRGSLRNIMRDLKKIEGYENFDKAAVELARRKYKPEDCHQTYGFAVTITYFYNSDFENVLNDLKSTIKSYDSQLQKEDSLKLRYKQTLENNTDKI